MLLTPQLESFPTQALCAWRGVNLVIRPLAHMYYLISNGPYIVIVYYINGL